MAKVKPLYDQKHFSETRWKLKKAEDGGGVGSGGGCIAQVFTGTLCLIYNGIKNRNGSLLSKMISFSKEIKCILRDS